MRLTSGSLTILLSGRFSWDVNTPWKLERLKRVTQLGCKHAAQSRKAEKGDNSRCLPETEGLWPHPGTCTLLIEAEVQPHSSYKSRWISGMTARRSTPLDALSYLICSDRRDLLEDSGPIFSLRQYPIHFSARGLAEMHGRVLVDIRGTSDRHLMGSAYRTKGPHLLTELLHGGKE